MRAERDKRKRKLLRRPSCNSASKVRFKKDADSESEAVNTTRQGEYVHDGGVFMTVRMKTANMNCCGMMEWWPCAPRKEADTCVVKKEAGL